MTPNPDFMKIGKLVLFPNTEKKFIQYQRTCLSDYDRFMKSSEKAIDELQRLVDLYRKRPDAQAKYLNMIKDERKRIERYAKLRNVMTAKIEVEYYPISNEMWNKLLENGVIDMLGNRLKGSSE